MAIVRVINDIAKVKKKISSDENKRNTLCNVFVF